MVETISLFGFILAFIVLVFLLQKLGYAKQKNTLGYGWAERVLGEMPLGILYVGADDKILYVNNKTSQFLGCRPEQLQGRALSWVVEDFFVPDAAGDFDQKSNNLLSAGKLLQMKKGNRAGEWFMLTLHDGKERDKLLLVEEPLMERELSDLRYQTRSVLDALKDAVVVTDKMGRIIFCNKAFEEITGLDNRPFLGKAMRELIKELRLNIRDNLSLEGIGDYTPVHDVFILTQRGERKDLLLHKAKVSNYNQEIIGEIYLLTDITSLKIEEQRLQQQEKMILLGQMASGLVHEIRNPLTAILGFSQLIGLKSGEKAIRDCAAHISSEVQNLNKVVSDFLAFAKPSPPTVRPIPVGAIIDGLRPMLDTFLFTKGVEVVYHCGAEEGTVLVDENQIKQVLLNVVSNAADAVTGREKPLITIETTCSNLLEEVCIKVIDNGRGMTREEIIKAGTPFFTTKEKGTGLGLSICYQIIKDHGGRIDINSNPGQGTTFIIFLPSAKDPARLHYHHYVELNMPGESLLPWELI